MPDRELEESTARRRFVACLVALALVAWLLRAWFVVAAEVEAPIRGDIRDYVHYAWNLIHHGVFSKLAPAAVTPMPDAYRGPGYPAFLALGLWLLPQDDRWYDVLLHAQAVLGSASCVLVALTARAWLSRPWAIFAGALLAFWPHHIVASGALLGEVLFGFLLALATWLVCREAARDPGAIGNAVAAGVACAAATLVNAIALPLALLAASWWAWRGARRAALPLALLPLLVAAAWEIRNANAVPDEEPSRSRVLVNLVQGAWPLYHAATNDRAREPLAAQLMQQIEAEERMISEDLRAGIAAILQRFGEEPGTYAYWYLIDKPWLLWDWSIRIGVGDVYFHRVQRSPLETHALLHAVKLGYRHANPWMVAMLPVFVLVVALGPRRRPTRFGAGTEFVAIAIAYLTLVHVVLQAEPRYAIAYRFLQALAVATILATLAEAAAATRRRTANPA